MCVGLFCAGICHSQTKRIDSALIFVQTHKQDDTLKINALLFVSNECQPINLQKALYYATLANQIANRLNNSYYKARCLSRLGSVQVWYGKTNEALDCYLKEIDLAKDVNSNYLLQDAYDGIAYVYETESEWEQSLQYGLKSLNISEKSTSPQDIAYSYHQLGSVYLGMGNNIKAELYLKKAKSIFNEYENTDRIALCNVDLPVHNTAAISAFSVAPTDTTGKL